MTAAIIFLPWIYPSTLVSMSNLALGLGGQGGYGEAKGMHWQATRLHETALGKEYPKILMSMDNLALVLGPLLLDERFELPHQLYGAR